MTIGECKDLLNWVCTVCECTTKEGVVTQRNITSKVDTSVHLVILFLPFFFAHVHWLFIQPLVLTVCTGTSLIAFPTARLTLSSICCWKERYAPQISLATNKLQLCELLIRYWHIVATYCSLTAFAINTILIGCFRLIAFKQL